MHEINKIGAIDIAIQKRYRGILFLNMQIPISMRLYLNTWMYTVLLFCLTIWLERGSSCSDNGDQEQ